MPQKSLTPVDAVARFILISVVVIILIFCAMTIYFAIDRQNPAWAIAGAILIGSALIATAIWMRDVG